MKVQVLLNMYHVHTAVELGVFFVKPPSVGSLSVLDYSSTEYSFREHLPALLGPRGHEPITVTGLFLSDLQVNRMLLEDVGLLVQR